MIADKIKELRETNSMTQNEVAKRLGITRSSVNAWEMGISVPSTMYIVELAQLFSVSADYILGLDSRTVLDISELDDESVKILNDMARYMRERQK
ncbi:helix-turn-helix transcriptional regulator [Lachnospiraceae bacterium 47-T17]